MKEAAHAFTFEPAWLLSHRNELLSLHPIPVSKRNDQTYALTMGTTMITTRMQTPIAITIFILVSFHLDDEH